MSMLPRRHPICQSCHKQVKRVELSGICSKCATAKPPKPPSEPSSPSRQVYERKVTPYLAERREARREAVANLRDWNEGLARDVTELKVTRGCEMPGGCPSGGGTDLHFLLDFHHLDPSTKLDSLSVMLHGTRYPEFVVWEEVEKCIVLHVRCHRILHERLRQAADLVTSSESVERVAT